MQPPRPRAFFEVFLISAANKPQRTADAEEQRNREREGTQNLALNPIRTALGEPGEMLLLPSALT